MHEIKLRIKQEREVWELETHLRGLNRTVTMIFSFALAKSGAIFPIGGLTLFEVGTGEILDGGRDEYDWTEDGVVGRAPVNGVAGRPDEVVEDGVDGRPLDGGGPRLDRKGEMLDRVERVDISPQSYPICDGECRDELIVCS